LEAIGKDPRELGFTILVLLLSIILLLAKTVVEKGWRGMKGNRGEVAKEIFSTDFKLVILLFFLVVLYHAIRSEWRMVKILAICF